MGWSDVHQYDMDYEEPEPVKQPHCPACGRFLSFNPSGEEYKNYPNGHWDYNLENWITDGPDFVGVEEPIWDCACGARWESDDLFK